MIGAANMLWDGTTNWLRAKCAATLADALANPGAGLGQQSRFLMGYNGTTWDQCSYCKHRPLAGRCYYGWWLAYTYLSCAEL